MLVVMKLLILTVLTFIGGHAAARSESDILRRALSGARQRRFIIIDDGPLLEKVTELFQIIEKFGSEKAKAAKAEVLTVLDEIQDIPTNVRNYINKKFNTNREVRAAEGEEVESNKKMMEKVVLLATLKFNEFKKKISAAFDKLQTEFKPIGDKYKNYGETISMVGVDGLKSFAQANVKIFNDFQAKVQANLSGLLNDGVAVLKLVKAKTLKPFGK